MRPWDYSRDACWSCWSGGCPPGFPKGGRHTGAFDGDGRLASLHLVILLRRKRRPGRTHAKDRTMCRAAWPRIGIKPRRWWSKTGTRHNADGSRQSNRRHLRAPVDSHCHLSDGSDHCAAAGDPACWSERFSSQLGAERQEGRLAARRSLGLWWALHDAVKWCSRAAGSPNHGGGCLAKECNP